MVVANHIPEERKLACGKHQIEPREISERRFREVAAEAGYIFLSERPSTGSEAAPIQVKAERTVLVPPGSQAESETNLSDAAGTDEPTRDGDAKEMGHEEYWQRRSSPEAMALLERFTQLLADRSV